MSFLTHGPVYLTFLVLQRRLRSLLLRPRFDWLSCNSLHLNQVWFTTGACRIWQCDTKHINKLEHGDFIWWRVEINIGIKHGFSCINIRQVPWEVLKTEAEGRGFQHLPRDLANVNTLKNHVRSQLLHKKWKHLLHFALFLALFCFAFSPMSRERNFHGLWSF